MPDLDHHNERLDRDNKRMSNRYIGPAQPLVWGSSHNDLFFVNGEKTSAPRGPRCEKIWIAARPSPALLRAAPSPAGEG